MARTAEGAALTARHREQQLALRALVIRDITRLWPLWSPGRVATFGRFADLAVTLIAARHLESAGMAAAYYRAFRAAEGIGGEDTPRMPARLTADDVVPSLRATALAGTMRAVRSGFSPQAASRSGLVQAAGSAGRLTMNGGRDLVLRSVGADRRAKGWVRVTAGGACGFCAMAASRGAVFKSDRTASFLAHDHCACSAEPVYPGSQVPRQNREFAELWQSTTVGLSGAEARAAFNKAVRAGT